MEAIQRDLLAIESAEEWKVRAILVALCNDLKVRTKAVGLLRKLDNTVPVTKPAQETIEICVQCDTPFKESENTKRACRFHNGDMEADYDLWPDHDEDCHGPVETSYNKRNYPEKFMWNCCDRYGDEPGCRMSRHQANPSKNKRLGLNDAGSECTAPSGDEEDEEDEEDEDEEDEEDEEDDEEDGEDEDEDDRDEPQAKKRKLGM
ncbi:hypothetical protein OQA88_11949 [Cercophora sp. LCS_1]